MKERVRGTPYASGIFLLENKVNFVGFLLLTDLEERLFCFKSPSLEHGISVFQMSSSSLSIIKTHYTSVTTFDIELQNSICHKELLELGY